MNINRELAIAAMKAASLGASEDFMSKAGIPMPEPIVPGALPQMIRETVSAMELKMRIDIVMAFTIGEFPDDVGCSLYYDPSSPWYNVIYGSYGIKSYKPDGAAWGYDTNGKPDWDEFFKLSQVDYDFLTAGQFGAKPSQMCFDIHHLDSGTIGDWNYADTWATIPSGLHDFRRTLGNPQSYLLYGIPDPTYLEGHIEFEPVSMRGRIYSRQMTTNDGPITLAWGTTCPDTPSGHTLLDIIMKTLEDSYMPLASLRVLAPAEEAEC